MSDGGGMAVVSSNLNKGRQTTSRQTRVPFKSFIRSFIPLLDSRRILYVLPLPLSAEKRTIPESGRHKYSRLYSRTYFSRAPFFSPFLSFIADESRVAVSSDSASK